MKEAFEIVDPFMAVCRARLTFERSSEPAVLVSQYHLCISLGGAFVWLVFKFPKSKTTKYGNWKKTEKQIKNNNNKKHHKQKKETKLIKKTKSEQKAKYDLDVMLNKNIANLSF